MELIDYIVAHELSHLIELNHSPAFWKTVASVFPHYKQVKKEVLRLTELYMAI
jgi:predicted metal-dependent hydrolase